ncbi:hypothetical protein HDU86_003367 [Geranomyces michiganensis]|nr:hypothetical protein HDU86_003367 [Geranomyces michiganensis]
MLFPSAAALFTLLASVAAPALGQATTAAGCPATDLKCLITTAQYSLRGTVVSNTANTTDTPAAYNATISVSCVYSSFTSPTGAGAFAGSDILVTGFGAAKAGCAGLAANPGDEGIFFVYVANRVGQNGTPYYSVFNPCAGNITPNSTANLVTMQSILSNPANAANVLNKGTGCALPAPATSSAPAPAAPTGSSASASGPAPAATTSTAPLVVGQQSAGFTAEWTALVAFAAGALTIFAVAFV